jgi:hypothetical protein
MSFRKFLMPGALVAALAFVGMQGIGATAAPKADGTITAKEVRSLIVGATGAAKLRGITPASAGIGVGISYKPGGGYRYAQSRIKSASCKKGSDWKSFWVTPTFDRGTQCNGKVRFHPVKKRSRAYFKKKMQNILDHIVRESRPGNLGHGQVTAITSNGEKAKVYFERFNGRGEDRGTFQVLQIEGSKVERVCPTGTSGKPPRCD